MANRIELIPDYCERAYGHPGILIALLRNKMPSMPTFDTLVGTGLSGALVVPTLARAVRKSWAIVRKKNEGTHSYRSIEGRLGKRWLFVDDFIDTGRTLRHVYQEVTQVASCHNFDTKFVGMWSYYPRGGQYVSPEQLKGFLNEGEKAA